MSAAKNFTPDEYVAMSLLVDRVPEPDTKWVIRRLVDHFRPWCGMPVPGTDGMMTHPQGCALPNGHDGECQPEKEKI